LGELLAPRKNTIRRYTPGLGGSSKCMSKTCKCCSHITTTKTFTSTHTRRQYNIIDPFNCRSTNIIYLITCSLCNKQYVGETQRQLSHRLTDHRSNIALHKNTPIANHFNLPGHSVNNIQITPICTVTVAEACSCREDDRKLKNALLRKESYWQNQLCTFEPNGINLRNQPGRLPEHSIEPEQLINNNNPNTNPHSEN